MKLIKNPFILIVLVIFLLIWFGPSFDINWFGSSFYNAVMFLIAALLAFISYQNYKRDEPKLVAQIFESIATLERSKDKVNVLCLMITNIGRVPILLTRVENKKGTVFMFSFINQEKQIENKKNYEREREFGYLLEPYKSFEDVIHIDDKVTIPLINKNAKINERIYKEPSQIFIRDSEDNKYQAIKLKKIEAIS